MAAGSRAGSHVVAVLKETTFKTEEVGPPDFDTAKIRIATWDVGTSFSRETIENQTVRVDFGDHKAGLGLTYPASELSFSTYADGLGTAAGDASAATITALGHLLAGCLGGTPAHSTGSTVKAASSPTTTSVAETDAGNHAENTLVPFGVAADGKVYVRPVATYATDTMTLLMALPTAPTVTTDVIYGATNIKDAQTAGYTLQGEVLGKNASQSYDYFGAVGNLSIPEAAPGEAQTLAFSFQIAKFSHQVGTTQVAPSAARPLVSAGGEFLIANHGSTATTELSVLRSSLETGRTYVADPDANDTDGLCGWVVTDQELRLTLTVKDADTPPSGGASTWRGSWESADDSTDNNFHILHNFGQTTAGRLFSFYLPQAHQAAEPEDTDVDGIAARTLVFAPTQGDSKHDAGHPSINENIWFMLA